jgi:hypothetical protein
LAQSYGWQANFRSGLWCNSSIFAREANGPGANPGFLTKALDGAQSIDSTDESVAFAVHRHLWPRSSTAIEHPDSFREMWVRFPSGSRLLWLFEFGPYVKFKGAMEVADNACECEGARTHLNLYPVGRATQAAACKAAEAGVTPARDLFKVEGGRKNEEVQPVLCAGLDFRILSSCPSDFGSMMPSDKPV